MSAYPSIPATVEIKRGRLFGLVAAVAALAAAVTWILVAVAFDGGSSTNTSSSAPTSAIVNPLPPPSLHFSVVAGPPAAAPETRLFTGYGDWGYTYEPGPVASSSAARDARKTPSVMSLTPARLAGNALGTGYALPTVQSGPTTASILASMSPQTRQYTKGILNLTFAQLAAGAAGQP